MDTREILHQILQDYNCKLFYPKGYHVDCVVMTDAPSSFVYSLTLTRMATQAKVSLTAFLDEPNAIKAETILLLQELMVIMGVH